MDKNNIHTGGGTYITDAVQVESGDFIGRDQITHIHQGSKPAPGTPPYRGLRFFDVEDAHRFFGREALTAELVDLLRSQRFLAVVGASGSGKSSLLRAGIASAIQSGKTLAGGVLPPLGSHQWPIHIMTPTAHPLETLVRNLVTIQPPELVQGGARLRQAQPTGRDERLRNLIDVEEPEQKLAQATQLLAELRQDPTTLHRHIVAYANSKKSGQRLLLIVDQFEEIFTLCQDQTERQAFVDNLIHAALDAPVNENSAIVIIALRADFYAHCAAFPNLRAALEQHQRYIGPMTITELQRAIEEPASRGGWDLEAGLVDLLLDDVEDAPGALPLLSHALLETWKRRSGHMLTIAGYLESGRVSGAIAHTAETVYQELNLEQQSIARNIFLRLTEVGDSPTSQYTRRRARMDEIVATDDDTLDVGQVLRKLVAARLVTTSQDERFFTGDDRHTYVEVAHEALLREWPTLQGWLADNREGLRVQHRLSEDSQEWQRMSRDDGLLYRGARLQQAVEWLVQRPAQLNDLEQNFLDQSQAEAQRVANLAEELRQQELEQQRVLTRAAEAQQRAELARAQEAEARALEQTEASQRLRRRAWLLSVAACIALLLAGYALNLLGTLRQEQRELKLANDNLGIANNELIVAEEQLQASNQKLELEFVRAEAERERAEEQRLLAEEKQRSLESEILAADVQRVLEQEDETGNQALALAIQAVTTTLEIDGIVQPNADAALRAAVNQAFWRHTIADASDVIAFSPNGDQLVTHSTTQTNTAWIWDVDNQQVAQTLHNVPDRLDIAAYHPDGTQLMLVGQGGVTDTLQLWDTATWEKIEPLQGITQTIQSAIYNPHGTAIAVATADNRARIFDLESGIPTAILEQDDMGRVNALAYSFPSGLLIASAHDDRNVYLWTVKNGQLGRVLSGHTASVKTVAFSPNNAYVASGSSDRTIRIWDTQTGEVVRILRGHTQPVQALLYIDNGERIVSASADDTIRIWDIQTGDQPYTLRGHQESITALSYDPLRDTIASASATTVRLWDTRPAAEKQLLQGHTRSIWAVAHHPSLPQIVSADGDGILHIWNSETGQSRDRFVAHEGAIRTVAYGPEGATILSAGDDHYAQLWNAHTGQNLQTFAGHEALIWSAAYDLTGQEIATASKDGTIRIWDRATATQLITLTAHAGDVHTIAYSPTDDQLASAGVDKRIVLWDSETWEVTDSLENVHTQAIRSIAYSPDGRQLASAGNDKVIYIWDLTTGEVRQRLTGHDRLIWSVAYSPDGKYLLSASVDKSLRVWDAATGELLRTLQDHRLSVNDALYTLDGGQIISVSSDQTVRLWTSTLDALLREAQLRLQ